MKSLIESLFGTYSPVTYEVAAGDTYETVVASGMAGVDWPYVLGILLFGIVLYSVLKCLNGILTRK